MKWSVRVLVVAITAAALATQVSAANEVASNPQWVAPSPEVLQRQKQLRENVRAKIGQSSAVLEKQHPLTDKDRKMLSDPAIWQLPVKKKMGSEECLALRKKLRDNKPAALLIASEKVLMENEQPRKEAVAMLVNLLPSYTGKRIKGNLTKLTPFEQLQMDMLLVLALDPYGDVGGTGRYALGVLACWQRELLSEEMKRDVRSCLEFWAKHDLYLHGRKLAEKDLYLLEMGPRPDWLPDSVTPR